MKRFLLLTKCKYVVIKVGVKHDCGNNTMFIILKLANKIKIGLALSYKT